MTVTVSGQSGSLTNGFTYVAGPTVTLIAEQRVDCGRDSGHDHRHKLRRRSDRNVWRNGGDQRCGGEQYHHYGHHSSWKRRCGDSDSNGRRAERKPGSGFTYVGGPTVTGVSPNSGPTAGGQQSRLRARTSPPERP